MVSGQLRPQHDAVGIGHLASRRAHPDAAQLQHHVALALALALGRHAAAAPARGCPRRRRPARPGRARSRRSPGRPSRSSPRRRPGCRRAAHDAASRRRRPPAPGPARRFDRGLEHRVVLEALHRAHRSLEGQAGRRSRETPAAARGRRRRCRPCGHRTGRGGRGLVAHASLQSMPSPVYSPSSGNASCMGSAIHNQPRRVSCWTRSNHPTHHLLPRQAAGHGCSAATACATSSCTATSASPRPPAARSSRNSSRPTTHPKRAPAGTAMRRTSTSSSCCKGWARFMYEDKETLVEAGDCVHQRPGIVHYLFDYSPDMEYLEIVGPADFTTVDVRAGLCEVPAVQGLRAVCGCSGLRTPCRARRSPRARACAAAIHSCISGMRHDAAGSTRRRRLSSLHVVGAGSASPPARTSRRPWCAARRTGTARRRWPGIPSRSRRCARCRPARRPRP